MKIVSQNLEIVNKIATVDYTAEGYIPSKFNVVEKKGDEYFVFNTLTRGMLLLSKEEFAKLIPTTTEGLKDGFVKVLVDNLFMVEKCTDETKRYFQIFNFWKTISPSPTKIKNAKIYTTTYCNARCFYCFEEGMPKSNMTLDTAEDVVKYLIANSAESQLNITWFGGEPLCNYKVIDYICDRLSEENVDFCSKIITNGYLFDDNIIQRVISKWKLDFVEITLDGTREEHNRRKAYVNPICDPYVKTINNIEKLSELPITVLIRLNFDRNNLVDIKEELKIVLEKFRKKDNVFISPAMLYENCFCHKGAYDYNERLALYSELKTMQDYLTEHGKSIYLPIAKKIKRSHCMGDNPGCRVINTDGRLYTCQSCDDSMHYGDIYSGITNPSVLEKWRNPKAVREKCVDCALLPECTPFDSCPVEQEFCYIINDYLLRKKIQETAKRFKQNNDLR